MRILIAAIFVFFCTTLMAAPDPGSRSIRLLAEQKFVFDPYPGPHARSVNEILQTIAEGSGKLRSFTSYTVHMQIDVIIEELSEHTYRLVVNRGTASVSGDKFYRDFSLEHVLLPDKADLTIIVETASGDLVLEERSYAVDLSENEGRLFESSFYFADDLSQLSVRLPRYFFYYDDRMLDRFERWTGALESYYAAGAMLQQIDALIEGLSAEDAEKILLDEFRLCEAEAILGGVRYAEFHEWFDIQDSDPEGVFYAYEQSSRKLRQLRLDFNFSIAHLDSLLFRKGMVMAGDTCLAAGQHLFLSAISFNPVHIPSHLALAQIELGRKDSLAALKRLGDVYEAMYPSGSIKAEANLITDSLLTLFYDGSWNLIIDNRHTESLAALHHVQDFCRRSEGQYRCSPLFNLLQRLSHRGVYRSFLQVSERALRNDNLALARTYLESAMAYQEAHQSYIPNHTEATVLLNRVFTRSRILFEIHSFKDEPEQAAGYLNAARELAQRHEVLFDFVRASGQPDLIKTAVINYAVVGLPDQSILMLDLLRRRRLPAGSLRYHQSLAGTAAAGKYSATDLGIEQKTLFRDIDLNDEWFTDFRQAFYDHLQ